MSDLLPCPFCGGEAILMTPAGSRPYIMCAERFCGGPQNSTEVAIAAWNRRAIPATGVAVKPLEWDDFCRNSFTAQSPFGDYVVELHDGDGWGMWTPDEGELAPDAHCWHQTEEAAKAAAQADYEARIRSALTVTPHDPAKVQALVEALDRLEVFRKTQMRTADCHPEDCGCYRCTEDEVFAALARVKGVV